MADEVITAFGRMGDWFASNLWSLDPDLICLAKGLTSGYLPLGATMLCDEVAEAMLSGGYFSHGFTYSGHPACGAAALANLNEIETLGLISRVKNDLGPYFQVKLQEIGNHPAVAEVRGYGLIAALELVPREGRDALTPASMLGLKAWSLIREEGAMVRASGTSSPSRPANHLSLQSSTNSSIASGADWTDSGTEQECLGMASTAESATEVAPEVEVPRGGSFAGRETEAFPSQLLPA